jgi:methyl-accepting chemotaxis protein
VSIRNKIIGVFVLIFVVGFAINFFVSSANFREEAIRGKVEQAQELTALLEKVREGMGEMFTGGFYDMEALLADPDKLFLAVPVVRSMLVGAELAEGADFKFKTPSFNPRNPDNTPTEFEARMLRRMEQEQLSTLWEVDEETNQLHYMRAIKLDENCMGCHGTLEESLTGTMEDPLGYRMEGWRPGDIHGAFEFILPLDGLDAALRANGFSSAALIGGIVVVGVALLFFMMNVFFTKPINTMMTSLEKVANNDLTVGVPEAGNDEIGKMARAFNKSVRNLGNLIREVMNSTQEVSNAAEQITSSSEEMATGAEEQQAQLSEIASSVEQMSAMILQASKNTSETQANTQTANQAAEEGRRAVAETITGIEQIAGIVNSASEQISALEQRSQEIGEVIRVIDDIADQTNLLALNANIEAARAGDAGRGFAVVADEVRKLAERTVKATGEIGEQIKQIQADVESSVKAMSLITEQSQAGQALAAQSGEALEKIASSINNVNQAMDQIASASSEQSSGAEEISKNVEMISAVARESASSAQQLAAMAEQLNQEAEELNVIIGQFRIAKIQWTKDYATGSNTIDSQHVQLFRRINDLVEASKAGISNQELKEVLGFLADYVVHHFGTEEKIMQKIKYPDFDSHKHQHDEFTKAINRIAEGFTMEGDNTEVINKLKDVSLKWLDGHIKKIDTKLAAYIRQAQA